MGPCFWSCTDDLLYNIYDEDDYDGEEISVPVTLSVQPLQSINPQSRAVEYIEPTEDEKTIHDLWVIEYHENGTRIGLPRFYNEVSGNSFNLNIIVPRRDCDKYTVVLIANSNDSELFNADNRSKFSTIDDLRKFELSTHNHEHVFNPGGDKFLLMSGWTTVTTDPATHKLSFNMVRNVCKVHVQLTAFPEDKLVYKYFQWRDVPLGKAFPHGTVDYVQTVDRDWREHHEDDPDNDLKYKDLREGIDFYLPCNVWLDLPPGTEMPGGATGPSNVQESSTHFVVVAREKIKYTENEKEHVIEGAEQYEFQLYPSKDKEKQFDFVPNHVYKMEIAINGLNPEDPFVDIIDYQYLQESNCYILRRDTKGGPYAIPITRINRYWEGYSEDGSELVDSVTEWVAEVIWQDSPLRLIDFASFKKFEAAQDLSYLEGQGHTYYNLKGQPLENEVPLGDGDELPMCISFRTTGSGEGNVIIGLRKKVPGWENIPVGEREYLWSWHLWITDYNPDYIIPADPSAGEIDAGGGNGDVNYQWMYHDVPNGEVQKYATSGEMAGSSLYMMDRNLGATKTFTKRTEADEIFAEILAGNWRYRLEEVVQTFGMYYQYGRKDPFPYYDPDCQKVYDIKGRLIPEFNNFPNMIISEQDEAWNSGQPTNVSIKHPYKFYTADRAHPFWYDWYLASDETDNHEWNDPGIGTFSGKKFFDPCPPGWKLPEDMYDTFTSIGQEDDTQWFDYLYDTEKSSENSSYNFFAAFMRYTEDGDFYKEKFIYFPSTGKRDPENGGGPGGNIWGFNAFNGTWTETKVMLVHNVPQANFESSLPACTGVPVRCMREYPN